MSGDFPALGHGVGLRAPHYGRILEEGISTDWVEVTTENFLAPGGRPRAVLRRVRRDRPVVLHGVSLAIGSVDALDEEYLRALRALADEIEPAWVSDHLCWGTHAGRYLHDLLPLPFTEEALAHVCQRVERVQELLGRRLVLENVSSYLTFNASTMEEWEFLAEVAARADCALLLDVNNVHVSARNHGFDPVAYLAHLPVEKVVQFHLAGHADRGTHLLDTHDGPVPAPVWELYAAAVRRFGPVPTLIEWDDGIPPLERLLEESTRAREIERRALAGEQV